MSVTIKTDFDLPIDIIPKELPKEKEIIKRLLQRCKENKYV